MFFEKNMRLFSVLLDSDVTQNERFTILQNHEFDLLITTPDLIHFSLNKKELQNFIINTKIIVFDEIHTYTGTFGTHVYYFLRRLERLLPKGKDLQYIGASATIANPVEFSRKIFDQENIIHIDCKSPKRNKTELYCIQRRKNLSKYEVIFQLVFMLIQSLEDEKIIIFRNSQQASEKTYEKLRTIKNKRIALHRAGLTKEQRMQIERRLRKNQIDIVITTSTLTN